MGTQGRTRVARGTLLLGALALGAAALASGTFGGLTRPGREQAPARGGTDTGEPSSRDPSSGPAEGPADQPGPGLPVDEGSPWVVTLLLVLVATALAVVVVAVVVAAGLRLVRHRPLRRGVGVRSGTTLLGEDELPPDEPETLLAALHRGLDDVGAGPPRNAIVATWLRLEDAVTGDRLPHHAADTPTEFVERALAAYGFDESAIRRLAQLYEEARFSLHPLTEVHRREARDCLERLLARVRQVGR